MKLLDQILLRSFVLILFLGMLLWLIPNEIKYLRSKKTRKYLKGTLFS